MYIPDIRQSDAWSSYLKMYGWKSLKLSNGSTLRIARYILSNRAQLLRPNNLYKGDLKEIDELCKKNGVLFVKISPDQDQNTGVFKSFGYKITKNIDLPPKTMVIHLSKSIDTLWNNLTNGCRYSINKSRRDEDKIEFIQKPNIDELNNYYNLMRKRGRKKKYYIPNMKDHIETVKAFKDKVFIGNVYNKSGDILGTKLFLGFNQGVWGMYSATTKLGQKSCGGYKLLWESFEYFKELGYKRMDLGGMTDDRVKKLSKKWEGYTFFKKQFNGEIVTFPMPYIKYFNIFV